jgi:hypothetical protein
MPIFAPGEDTELSLVTVEIEILERKKVEEGLTHQEESRLQYLYNIGQSASSDVEASLST